MNCRYPLQQPIYDHGYNWETWKLMPVGMFHTVGLEPCPAWLHYARLQCPSP